MVTPAKRTFSEAYHAVSQVELNRLTPKSLLEGTEKLAGKEKIHQIVKNLSHSVFSQVQNLLSIVGKGQWVDNKSVLHQIEVNIKELNNTLKEHPDEASTHHQFLKVAIGQMLGVCETLKRCGVQEKAVGVLINELAKLKISGNIAISSKKKERIDKEEAFKNAAADLGRIDESVLDRDRQKPQVAHKARFEKYNQKQIRTQLIQKLPKLIESAYAFKQKGQNHSFLESSLGQNFGSQSHDNVRLKLIKNFNYTYVFTKEFKDDINLVINLIEKGFKQKKVEIPEEVSKLILEIDLLMEKFKERPATFKEKEPITFNKEVSISGEQKKVSLNESVRSTNKRGVWVRSGEGEDISVIKKLAKERGESK